MPVPPPPDPSNLCLSQFWESVALDDQRAYLTGSGSHCAPVVRVSLDGSGASPMPLVGDGLGEGIALDATSVFITRPLRRAPKDASAPSDWVDLSSTNVTAEGLALDATHLYWIEGATLRKAKKDGSGQTTLASWTECGMGFYPFNVAVNAAHVYWIEGCSDTLHRVDLDGQHETVIDSGGTMLAVLADRGTIYWTAYEANELRRLRVPHDTATGAALP